MVGAPGAPSQSARTTGWPPAGTTRPPANASRAASHSAAWLMVAALASRLTLGTATNSASSLRYPASPGGRLRMAAVDGDDLPGDPRRLRRGEEPHAVGDVVGLA